MAWDCEYGTVPKEVGFDRAGWLFLRWVGARVEFLGDDM